MERIYNGKKSENYETLDFLHDFDFIVKKKIDFVTGVLSISNSKMKKEIMWHGIIQSHAAQCGKNENSLSLVKIHEST